MYLAVLSCDLSSRRIIPFKFGNALYSLNVIVLHCNEFCPNLPSKAFIERANIRHTYCSLVYYISSSFSEFVSHSALDGCTNKWKLVGVVNNSQRRSDERVRRKTEKIKQFAREAARSAVPEGVSPEDPGEMQRLREALQEVHAANLRDREVS